MPKDRKDGYLIRPKETYAIIMPYLFRTRTESLVYYTMNLDIDPALAYIHQRKAEGNDITLFQLVIAACVQTVRDFPDVNRFVCGKRLYQHKDMKVSYTIKHKMELKSPETSVTQAFELDSTLEQVRDEMNKAVESARANSGNNDDEKIIGLVQNLPRPLFRLLLRYVRWSEYHDCMPKAFYNALPFNCTLFLSNMGSLGMNAPQHHLYELGSCSVFLTMGRLNRENYIADDGSVKKRSTMMFNWTIDERIVDGFYLSRVLRNFEHLLKHPELLEIKK